MRPRAVETAVLVLIAIACALAPFPSDVIERVYSNGWYLQLQNVVTTASNTIPIAWLDIAVACLLIAALELVVSRVRKYGPRKAFGRNLITAAGTASLLYLVFLVCWGLNYRRVPLEQKLDYEKVRVTAAAAVSFLNTAVASINGGYAAAHEMPANIAGLDAPFADAQIALGATRLAVTGTPKRSLLTYYFRRAAIDGMTDPFFLEIIVNPDVLEFERPFVVTHEWAHLAGYASEEEANFVAWLTCVHGDALSRYSAWLAAYQHTLAALPPSARSTVKPLEPGPLADIKAMSARYERSSPAVRKAARGVYDGYLRANRVTEGIASYDAVVRLMLGTRFDARWVPQRR